MFQINLSQLKGLSVGCSYGQIEVIEKMISKGANDWDNALMSACFSGNIEVVRKIIEKGATSFSQSLTSACVSGNIDIVKLMVEKGADSFDMALGSIRNIKSEQIVKYLIEKGVNSLDKTLLECTSLKNVELVELLLNKGADLNFLYRKKSVIQAALETGYYPTIILLIFVGVSLDGIVLKPNTKRGLFDLIEDTKTGKLWNSKRSQYFPKLIQTKVFSFFLSINQFSKKINLKLPKPISIAIVQFWTQKEIEFNRNSRNKK